MEALHEKRKIEGISFEEILPLWQELWPNRVSAIEEVSCLDRKGNVDMTIQNFKASFLGISNLGDEIASVVSFHPTSKGELRLRGLYTKEQYRKQGFATALLNHCLDLARQQSYKVVWTLPRKSSWPVYENVGFELLSEWKNEPFEFGPNAFAMMKLR